ncbi:MAG: Na+/H+ antiporter subunit B [Thermoguttaceae bacterium]
MTTLILQTATRYLLPLMLLFSIFLVLRGHQEPGGGFVGGLVASAALVLYAIAYDVKAARHLLRCDPRMLIGTGMLVALGSGLVSFLAGRPLMTGLWASVVLPGMGTFTIGTPVVFDIGVYLVVLGTALTIMLSLAEQ